MVEHEYGAKVDVERNRRAKKWTAKQLAGRLLWEALRGPSFAWTPRQLWVWRRIVLRIFGAKVANRVHIFPTVQIAIPWNVSIGCESAIGDRAILYSLGEIVIGARTTISQGAHLCAGSHDYRYADLPLTKHPIQVGNGAWVCADAFIGPGVTIGHGAIVGARAVVVKDVFENQIVAGNPARLISNRKGFLREHP